MRSTSRAAFLRWVGAPVLYEPLGQLVWIRTSSRKVIIDQGGDGPGR